MLGTAVLISDKFLTMISEICPESKPTVWRGWVGIHSWER